MFHFINSFWSPNLFTCTPPPPFIKFNSKLFFQKNLRARRGENIIFKSYQALLVLYFRRVCAYFVKSDSPRFRIALFFPASLSLFKKDTNPCSSVVLFTAVSPSERSRNCVNLFYDDFPYIYIYIFRRSLEITMPSWELKFYQFSKARFTNVSSFKGLR